MSRATTKETRLLSSLARDVQGQLLLDEKDNNKKDIKVREIAERRGRFARVLVQSVSGAKRTEGTVPVAVESEFQRKVSNASRKIRFFLSSFLSQQQRVVRVERVACLRERRKDDDVRGGVRERRRGRRDSETLRVRAA